MITSPQRVFLLGVGAQKAGTTWVHDLLSRQPEARLGVMKEYHIFDAVTLPHCARFQVPAPIAHLSRIGAMVGIPVAQRLHLRDRCQRDSQHYFDYFSGLLAQGGLSGDITPSYSGLDSDTLRQIADGFRERGVAVRAFFLMRDPVDRCISAVNMNRTRRNCNESVTRSGDLNAALEGYYQTADAIARTNYHETVQRLQAVFPPEHLFFSLTEDFFQPTEIARFEAVIGFKLRGVNFKRRINANPATATIDPDLAARVAEFYWPAIESAFTLFGESRVRACWPSARGGEFHPHS